MKDLLANIFSLYKECRSSEIEPFGDFCYRAGTSSMKEYISLFNSENVDQTKLSDLKEKIKNSEMPVDKNAKDFIGGLADAPSKILV